MSLEMPHKVIVPQKKNYVAQFLKQRDINSYYTMVKNVLVESREKRFNTFMPRCIHKTLYICRLL